MTDNNDRVTASLVDAPSPDQKLISALRLVYGTQVASEFNLISEVLCKVAKENGVQLNESDLDTFCRQRQAKLTVHAIQNSNDPFERVRLLNMLYEGCLSLLSDAIVGFDGRADLDAPEKLTRAREIISYLAETLNFADGGEISVKLLHLYEFSDRKIKEALRLKSATLVQTVQQTIRTIYSAYLEIEIRQDIQLLLCSREKCAENFAEQLAN